MTEKIGLVKNPLTIIAIFAGIAEVSGTIVLPFVNEAHQGTFIYFLIIFPILLICAFFLTLNFNNKVLYAPSDYRDEENYLKIFRFDSVSQETVVVKSTVNETITAMAAELAALRSTIDSAPPLVPSPSRATAFIAGEPSDEVKTDFTYSIVSKLPNVARFIAKMGALGYNFDLYNPPSDRRPVLLPKNWTV